MHKTAFNTLLFSLALTTPVSANVDYSAFFSVGKVVANWDDADISLVSTTVGLRVDVERWHLDTSVRYAGDTYHEFGLGFNYIVHQTPNYAFYARFSAACGELDVKDDVFVYDIGRVGAGVGVDYTLSPHMSLGVEAQFNTYWDNTLNTNCQKETQTERVGVGSCASHYGVAFRNEHLGSGKGAELNVFINYHF
jgi:hypothetical protein